jgi:hypothetical protein
LQRKLEADNAASLPPEILSETHEKMKTIKAISHWLKGVAFAGVIVTAGVLVGCSSRGHVSREALVNTSVKALPGTTNSPFLNYDAKVVQAVQARWYDLIAGNEQNLKTWKTGTVIVLFRILPDGQIDGLRVTDSSADHQWAQLCQRAVADASPFKHWPRDMLEMAEQPFREVRFTFNYE